MFFTRAKEMCNIGITWGIIASLIMIPYALKSEQAMFTWVLKVHFATVCRQTCLNLLPHTKSYQSFSINKTTCDSYGSSIPPSPSHFTFCEDMHRHVNPKFGLSYFNLRTYIFGRKKISTKISKKNVSKVFFKKSAKNNFFGMFVIFLRTTELLLLGLLRWDWLSARFVSPYIPEERDVMRKFFSLSFLSFLCRFVLWRLTMYNKTQNNLQTG